jgi:hypothetical protein
MVKLGARRAGLASHPTQLFVPPETLYLIASDFDRSLRWLEVMAITPSDRSCGLILQLFRRA